MRISQVPDPYLRKRIVIVKASQPMRTWLLVISFVLLCVLVGLLIYFFPQIKHKVENLTSAPVNHQSSSTVNATQQPTTEVEAETELAAQPSTTASTPVEPERVDSPSTFSAPAATLVESEPVDSASIDSSTETASTTEPVEETTTTTEAAIAKLVTLAGVQLERQRFTSPAGDNAYETYQALKSLAPNKAQAVLEHIVNWYFIQGQDYLTQNRIKQPNRNDAYEMYEVLAEIAPEHPHTQQLLADIMTRLTAKATEYLQNKQLVEPEQDNAYRIYQLMHTIAPENPIGQQLLDSIVQELLQHAQQQMANHHYTTPKRDNASDTYKQILKIDADNLKAQQGIQAIIDRYHQLALKYFNQGNHAASLTMIERGLDVHPQAPQLLHLKQKLLEQ